MEEDIFKFLSEMGGEKLGVIGAIAAALVLFWRRFNRIFEIILKLYQESIFEKYNSNLILIQSFNNSYSFRTVFLKKNSQEIFETMKAIYDKVAVTNVPDKTIKFKMYEVPDNAILYANILRFLDYYKSRNGVKIHLFLHESLSDTKNHMITDLKNHLTKTGIHGVKIIKGHESEKRGQNA